MKEDKRSMLYPLGVVLLCGLSVLYILILQQYATSIWSLIETIFVFVALCYIAMSSLLIATWINKYIDI